MSDKCDTFVDLVEAGEFDCAKFFQKKTTSAWHVTDKVESGHGVNTKHEEVERLHMHNARTMSHGYY